VIKIFGSLLLLLQFPFLQNLYYSGKSKKHAIKYEVAVKLETGEIVWVTGGVPGRIHDLKLYRMGGLNNLLLPGEYLLADKAYIGGRNVITPYRGAVSPRQRQWNHDVSSKRQIVEHTFARIKYFQFTQKKWRNDRALHPRLFTILCHIVNIDMIYHPMRT